MRANYLNSGCSGDGQEGRKSNSHGRNLIDRIRGILDSNNADRNERRDNNVYFHRPAFAFSGATRHVSFDPYKLQKFDWHHFSVPKHVLSFIIILGLVFALILSTIRTTHSTTTDRAIPAFNPALSIATQPDLKPQPIGADQKAPRINNPRIKSLEITKLSPKQRVVLLLSLHLIQNEPTLLYRLHEAK